MIGILLHMSSNGQMQRVSSPFPGSTKNPTFVITLKPLRAYYRKSLTYKLVLLQKALLRLYETKTPLTISGDNSHQNVVLDWVP